MFNLFKKANNEKLSETIDSLFLLLLNTEIMSLNKLPSQNIELELQKIVFVFTVTVIRPIRSEKVNTKNIILCKNYANKKMEIREYIDHFKNKSYNIGKAISFSQKFLDEIYEEKEYFTTLANKYESGELEFV